MALCKRPCCTEEINWRTPAGKMRLCETHYQHRSQREQRLAQKKSRVCRYCQASLANTRNTVYCCCHHRQLGSRKWTNALNPNLLTHSYWYQVEKAIKQNPRQLGSVFSPADIATLLWLYQRKAHYQLSYYHEPILNTKPTPLLQLDLCHWYPNSKGGMNTGKNIVIAPSYLNQLIGNRIPDQSKGFPGIKSPDTNVPLNGSLYDALVSVFGISNTIDSLGTVKLSIFRGSHTRPLSFRGVDKALPLFTLLRDELMRLGQQSLLRVLKLLHGFYAGILPLVLELMAMMIFYALLTGDRDRFLARLQRFCDWFYADDSHLRHRFRCLDREAFEGILQGLLRKYLFLFFGIQPDDQTALIALYNRFFAREVITEENGNEIRCYAWNLGVQRSSITPRVVLVK